MTTTIMIIIAYLMATYVFMFVDALVSLATKKRFILFNSIISSLLWPVTTAAVIFFANEATKQFQDPNQFINDEVLDDREEQ